MKVILKQDHDKLGKTGEALNVKDGYAMNYLIPNHIAMRATDSNLRALDELKKQKAKKTAKEFADIQTMGAELEKVTLEIKANADDDEKLFGSVSPQNIIDALAEKGFTIDKKSVILDEPIKHLGIFTVNIKLNNNITSPVKVSVVREQP
jgi:large subunit ribosomal protein L9